MGWCRKFVELPVLAMVILYLFVGCKPLRINNVGDRIQPSNARTWTPDLAVLPSAEVDGNEILIRNIRNINYLTNEDFVVKHFDRTISLDDVRTVDFVVTPFNQTPLLAHTMLSFGLADGTYLGVSVEVRKERDESYSPILGLSRQFEIMYVIADERDLIRLRTRHRDADVYIYPSVANPEQAQQLFVDVLDRVNRLKVEPEFYNTLRNNCTTNLAQHVNRLKTDRIAIGWRVLLPGFSAKYAYDLGLLDNRIPFEDLKALSYVNDLADEHYDAADFSRLIRSKRSYIPRLISRQQARQSTLDGTGQKYLNDQFPRQSRIWR